MNRKEMNRKEARKRKKAEKAVMKDLADLTTVVIGPAIDRMSPLWQGILEELLQKESTITGLDRETLLSDNDREVYQLGTIDSIYLKVDDEYVTYIKEEQEALAKEEAEAAAQAEAQAAADAKAKAAAQEAQRLAKEKAAQISQEVKAAEIAQIAIPPLSKKPAILLPPTQKVVIATPIAAATIAAPVAAPVVEPAKAEATKAPEVVAKQQAPAPSKAPVFTVVSNQKTEKTPTAAKGNVIKDWVRESDSIEKLSLKELKGKQLKAIVKRVDNVGGKFKWACFEVIVPGYSNPIELTAHANFVGDDWEILEGEQVIVSVTYFTDKRNANTLHKLCIQSILKDENFKYPSQMAELKKFFHEGDVVISMSWNDIVSRVYKIENYQNLSLDELKKSFEGFIGTTSDREPKFIFVA